MESKVVGDIVIRKVGGGSKRAEWINAVLASSCEHLKLQLNY